MMRNIKKLFSILVILSLVLSTAPAAYADSVSDASTEAVEMNFTNEIN